MTREIELFSLSFGQKTAKHLSLEGERCLGSKLTSDGRCAADILRRISRASATMNDLNCVWWHKKLGPSVD